MARFLVDESLPRAATRALVAAGHDAVDARDVGLRGTPDETVMDFARTEGRIVVSADTDFSNILAFPPGSHPGVVVLRVPAGWNSEQRSGRLVEAVSSVGDAELAQAIVIVEPSRCRVFGGRRDSGE